MDEFFVDSNIIIRFIVKDDPAMYQVSKKFFTQIRDKEKKGLVSILVFQEVVWVLSHYYKLKRWEVVDSLQELILLEKINIFDPKKEQILDLLKYYGQSNLDLVDIYLHLEAKKANGQLMSFDEQLMSVGDNFLSTAWLPNKLWYDALVKMTNYTFPTVQELLEAGVHFGHSVNKWNPKMESYIYAAKQGVHILDLDQTAKLLKEAGEYLFDTASKGGQIIFVCTKKQVAQIAKDQALRCGAMYMN